MTIAYLIFAIIAAVFGLVFYEVIYKPLSEKSYNDSQPIIIKTSKISAKRVKITGGGQYAVDNTYFAAFEFTEDKSRIEFEIEPNEYGLLSEGDLGTLTFQGRRFLGFQRTK